MVQIANLRYERSRIEISQLPRRFRSMGEGPVQLVDTHGWKLPGEIAVGYFLDGFVAIA